MRVRGIISRVKFDNRGGQKLRRSVRASLNVAMRVPNIALLELEKKFSWRSAWRYRIFVEAIAQRVLVGPSSDVVARHFCARL